MKKVFHFIAAFIITGFSGLAVASPVGPYAFFGGGVAYLANSHLEDTVITRRLIDPFTATYSINYKFNSALGYTGRVALGYFFNNNPENTYALGAEAGFNYFFPMRQTLQNHLITPPINNVVPLSTTMKTAAWAADMAFVYSQDLIIPHTALIFKLGVGYAQVSHKLTNTVTDLSGVLPASKSLFHDGVGVVGGVGLQYNFSSHVAMRLEFDGLVNGTKQVGYAQGLAGIVWSFL